MMFLARGAVKVMMYGYGDAENPFSATVDLLEVASMTMGTADCLFSVNSNAKALLQL